MSNSFNEADLRSPAEGDAASALAESALKQHLFASASRASDRFGFERSVQFTAHGVSADRFLLSFGAPRGLNWLAETLMPLGAPQAAREVLERRYKDAAFVHLGFDGISHTGGPPTVKAYLEYDLPANPSTGTLVHDAMKWRPNGGSASHDAYKLLSPDDAFSLVDTLFPTQALPSLRHLMNTSLELARQDAPFALEVVSAKSLRRSIDLRLYHQDVAIETLVPLFDAALSEIGCTEPLAKFHSGADPIGHLAAGIGANGAPFITIYGGAEERSSVDVHD